MKIPVKWSVDDYHQMIAGGILCDRRTVVIHSQFQRPDQLDKYVELGMSPSSVRGQKCEGKEKVGVTNI